MAKYRRRIEIVADILRIVANGARKTHIMYQCNLSYKLLKRYLREVSKAELIQVDGDRSDYEITEKGKLFLEKFESYLERSKKMVQQIDMVNHEKALLEKMISGKTRPVQESSKAAYL